MYNKDYDETIIREENSDFVDFVIPFLSKDTEMIDLGCGTCRKVVKLSPFVKHVDAIDRNESMIKQSADTLKNKNIENVSLFLSDNFHTPFQSHKYDVCTTALSTWSVAEVHRILKPTGRFFVETLCPDDKFEIKEAFGKDAIGQRGYLYNQTTRERMFYLTESLKAFFEIETVRFTEKRTTLTEEGFLKLLGITPTIRDFSLEKDANIVADLVKNGKVSFTEKRIIIMAKAKNIQV